VIIALYKSTFTIPYHTIGVENPPFETGQEKSSCRVEVLSYKGRILKVGNPPCEIG